MKFENEVGKAKGSGMTMEMKKRNWNLAIRCTESVRVSTFDSNNTKSKTTVDNSMAIHASLHLTFDINGGEKR